MKYSNVQELFCDISLQIKESSSDDRLLFDLDLYNILKEIRDVYDGYPEQIMNTVERAALLAYAIYWSRLSAKLNRSIGQQELELMGELIAAAVYHLANSDNVPDSTSYAVYESRWEPSEIVEFLLHTCALNREESLQELKILNYSASFHADVWELYCTLDESIALAHCETENEYQELRRLFQDDAGIDSFIALAKCMHQPKWFVV